MKHAIIVAMSGVLATASVIVALAFAWAVYFAFIESYASERARVVDRIEQFRQRHGRYPKSLKEANVNLDDDWSGHYYEVVDGDFRLQLSAQRWLPPGDRIWFYHSKTGDWSYSTETD